MNPVNILTDSQQGDTFNVEVAYGQIAKWYPTIAYLFLASLPPRSEPERRKRYLYEWRELLRRAEVRV